MNPYLVEITDREVSELPDVSLFIASDPHDAMLHAIQLYNDSWNCNLTLSAVSKITLLSSEEPFFTKSARKWFWGNYGDSQDETS